MFLDVLFTTHTVVFFGRATSMMALGYVAVWSELACVRVLGWMFLRAPCSHSGHVSHPACRQFLSGSAG